MKTQLNTLLNRVDTRLAACAAAAGASLAVVPSSDANIVYSGPVNIAIPNTTPGVYLNVVTGVNNPSPGAVPGWDVNPFGTTNLSFFAASPNASHGYIINAAGGTSATLVDNLPFNFTIGVGPTYGANNTIETTGSTAWNFNSTNNFVGFRFLNQTGVQSFGWLQVSLGATQLAPRAIVGYAYDDAGGTIGAGVVPEPSTFALLGVMAVGALGVRAWRGRKAT